MTCPFFCWLWTCVEKTDHKINNFIKANKRDVTVQAQKSANCETQKGTNLETKHCIQTLRVRIGLVVQQESSVMSQLANLFAVDQ